MSRQPMADSDPLIHGLRFYSNALEVEEGEAPIFIHHAIEQGRSDFDLIFSPLYGHWSGHVLLDGFEWQGSEWEDEQYLRFKGFIVENSHGSRLISSGVLAEFGRFIGDDWAGSILFSASQPSMSEMLQMDRAFDFKSWSRFQKCPQARAVLHNWDGVYWEIFCKEKGWIERLIAYHHSNKQLCMFKVDPVLDYPNPRNGVELPPARPEQE